MILSLVGRCSIWNNRKELCKEKYEWPGELKYIVMDGWIKLVPLTRSDYLKLQREKRTSSSIQWCQNSDLNGRKTEKSSQTKLATGACKNWIFFAVDNFPPCIPVTIFPQYRAPVAGQPEPPPFGPCCSCSFFWTRDAFHKFSQSYDMVGLTASLLVDLDWTFWVNTTMARQQ